MLALMLRPNPGPTAWPTAWHRVKMPMPLPILLAGSESPTITRVSAELQPWQMPCISLNANRAGMVVDMPYPAKAKAMPPKETMSSFFLLRQSKAGVATTRINMAEMENTLLTRPTI